MDATISVMILYNILLYCLRLTASTFFSRPDGLLVAPKLSGRAFQPMAASTANSAMATSVEKDSTEEI